MTYKGPLAVVLATIICSVVPSAAFGFAEVAPPGEGAGRVSSPQGLAVDLETGDLYIADQGNNRVDVFDSTGNFKYAFGWGVGTGANLLQTCTATCQKGIAGAGKGQFNAPGAVAVDNDPLSASYQDVYVVDFANRRVERFDVTGGTAEFILTFGGGVNKTKAGEGKTSEEDVCTALSGDICGPGSNGFGSGEFSARNGSKILAGVASAGIVYVADSRLISEQPFAAETRLQKFNSSGEFIFEKNALSAGLLNGFGVDSTDGFYIGTVGQGGSIIKQFDSSGLELNDISAVQIGAIAVDTADNVFAGEQSPRTTIAKYASDGTPLLRFGYGILKQTLLNGLAAFHSASGDIYVSEGSRVVHLDFPPPGPLIIPAPCAANPVGSGRATLTAEVNPEGKATTAHFQYLTQAQFESGGFSNPATKTSPESPSIGEDIELHQASVQVTGLAPETDYRCRVVATSGDGSATGEDGTFKTRNPEILATFASPVGVESATLNAVVNPWGIGAGGFFEYVDDVDFNVSGFAGATIAPIPPDELDFGAEENPKTDSATLVGLVPCTLYHYHVVVTAKSVAAPPLEGPERTFRTFCPSGSLPDSRKYELVSPGQKNSAEVAVPGAAGGLVDENNYVRMQAGSPSGEAITYTSFTSFANPKGAPGTSQYLSRRGADHWVTANISLFGSNNNPFQPPYRGFTPDLGFGGVVVSQPPCAEGAVAGVESLCLRDNSTGTLQPLTIEVPEVEAGETFCTAYAGSSVDGRHVFFAANGAFAGAPKVKGFSLYEWGADKGLTLVSVLVNGSPANPTSETAFGAKGGGCTVSNKIRHNVVSADGGRVFWTYVPKSPAQTQLLARVNAAQTVQLDAKVAGSIGPSGGGVFQAASADGSVVFFTGANPLVAGAHAGDLYRYDLEAATKPLEDLTKSTEAAGVQGLLGISEDGSYTYFAATAVLSGEEENANGEKAQAGKSNLYLWHLGDSAVHFIATVSAKDAADWSPNPTSQSARVSADGRYLAFLSLASESLSGYDNTIAAGPACQVSSEGKLIGDPHCPQAYLYSAEADEFTCVSCNPSGARPLGPTVLPGWSNPYEGPRYLSSDGSRLFFESFDTLSPNDENTKRDVYEAELPGAGSCSSESTGFDPTSGLCLSLISSGEDEDETYLLDASADGRDVFLATRKRLLGWDVNDNYDVYDAREGGGFPEPPVPPPPCVGEACRPPVTEGPRVAPTATNTFSGPGNPKPKKHKPRKHKKKHRHHKRHNHQKGRVQR